MLTVYAPENKTFRDKMRKFSVAFSKLFRNFLIFSRKEMKQKESEILREKCEMGYFMNCKLFFGKVQRFCENHEFYSCNN